ncbi:MAG: class I SAM-dependent methyltransferase [Rubrivivax sp.]|nr:class I SAM-dependent methyltransferase [Rubrivivax sp.]
MTSPPRHAPEVKPATAVPDPNTAVWSRYWAQGALHSCATSYDGAYGGALAAFWRTQFVDLKPGQQVLDIATGNGALPQLLLQTMATTGFQCDAIDRAAIVPTWAAALPPTLRERLRFHAQIAAEQLPFADSRFDLVISQYGIEYAELPQALRELLRVLRPDGRVALVLHHAASRPALLARIELDHIGWLRAADGLLAAAADMVAPVVEAATAEGRARLSRSADAEALRQRFNAAQVALRQRLEARHDGADVLQEAQDATARVLQLAGTRGEAAARLALQRFHLALSDQQARLTGLCEHALDEPQVQQVGASLRAAGRAVNIAPLHEGPHLMGWSLVAAPQR